MPKKKTPETVLELQGTLDITNARELRDQLLATLEKGSQVTVKLAGVSDADLTFCQLLCAAHREAAAQGKRLTIDSSGIQEPLQKLLVAGGVTRQFDCQHAKGQKCLWCGEGW